MLVLSTPASASCRASTTLSSSTKRSKSERRWSCWSNASDSAGCQSSTSPPEDAALMMQLGVDGLFVGSGIFKSEDPLKRAKAIVAATTYFDKPEMLAEVSAGLGKAMPGLEIPAIPKEELLAARGW